MERRGNHIAITRQADQEINRLVVDRAGCQAMRKNYQRPTPATGRRRKNGNARLRRQDRQLSCALHARQPLSIGQQVIRTEIGGISRVTGDNGKIDLRIAPAGIKVVVRHTRPGDQRIGRLKQNVADIAVVGTIPEVVNRAAKLCQPGGVDGQIGTGDRMAACLLYTSDAADE